MSIADPTDAFSNRNAVARHARPPKGFDPAPAPPPQAHPQAPRLPAVGTVLTKEHGGETHAIPVLAEGFEYRGELYPSLSIEVEGRDVWVEFPFSAAYLDSLVSAEDLGSGSGQTTQETREKTRERTREKALALIAELPTITTAELAERIGITAKGIEWQLHGEVLEQFVETGERKHCPPSSEWPV